MTAGLPPLIGMRATVSTYSLSVRRCNNMLGKLANCNLAVVSFCNRMWLCHEWHVARWWCWTQTQAARAGTMLALIDTVNVLNLARLH